ncbi:MAG TPA: DUF6320 domain-containing protein [Microlunatus sp.]|nr:DUF6320 domain-containing protein [Microlunatus sp.]
MSRCDACAVAVEGAWARCPLCGGRVTGEPAGDPVAVVPLKFSRRRVLRVLFGVSLAVVGGSFAAQLLFSREGDGIGVLRSIWLGVVTMWLVVVMALRKRRNAAKGTVYLVALVGLCCVYWDFLTGWHGWALTYVVPIVCACSVVAVLITVAVMRIELGDHVVYSGLTALLGLAPLLFLLLGWVNHPLPSVISAALGFFALMALQVLCGAEVRHELAQRLHL